jgi:ABC-type sugar transport system permease subunit
MSGRPSTRNTKNDWRIAVPFMLPALALVSTFILYPIALTFWMSLNEVDQFGRFKGFVGIAQYAQLLADPPFVEAFWRTVVWTLVIVGATTMIGLFVAVALHQKFKGRTLVRALLLLPWATGLLIVSLLWRWMAHPDFGAIGHFVASVGFANLRVEWLGNPALSFPLMMWVGIWASIPFTTLVIAAGLSAIDQSVYEAAALDGANQMRMFSYITLPLLRPVLAVSVLLRYPHHLPLPQGVQVL